MIFHRNRYADELVTFDPVFGRVTGTMKLFSAQKVIIQLIITRLKNLIPELFKMFSTLRHQKYDSNHTINIQLIIRRLNRVKRPMILSI